jgi:hypothetical protein
MSREARHATFRASALKCDPGGRPQCASCGKVAMSCHVTEIAGEAGKLAVYCRKCGRVFATIAPGVFPITECGGPSPVPRRRSVAPHTCGSDAEAARGRASTLS